MSDAEVSRTPTGSVSVRTSDDVPVVVRVEQAHGAMLQNLGAIAAIVSFVLTGHISGEVGLGAIMVVAGVIAYPGIVKKGGAGMVGSIGILGAVAQIVRSFHSAIPFVVFAAASLLQGCATLPDTRNSLNEIADASARVGALIQAACPAELPESDPLFATCRDGKVGFEKIAQSHAKLQDLVDGAAE